MNLAVRLATGTMLSLALVSVPASARPFRGGYHGGHYRHHGGGGIGTLGGVLLGAAVLGTVAAVASSNNRRDRDVPRYAAQPYGDDTGYGSYDDRYARNDPRAVAPPAYGNDDGDRYADEPAGYDDQSAGGDPVDDCARAAERKAQNGGGFARVTDIDRVDEIDGGANVRGRLQVEDGRSSVARSLSFSCSASYGEVRSLRLG